MTKETEQKAAEQAPAFWREKPLDALNPQEWEALCDGCARCCLMKLEDIDTGEIAWTDIACRLLDHESCRCKDYDNRSDRVPDCVRLDAETAKSLTWLPPTCAYRLRAEDRPLADWHPLVSGSSDTVHTAGISVRGRIVAEDDILPDDLEDHVVAWPGEG